MMAARTIGPPAAKLTVQTGKAGAAAVAGHNLLIEVTSWSATLDDDSLTLTADATSMRVLEGSGGIQPLGEDDRAGITKTIDEDVLKGGAIEFHSTSVAQRDNGVLHVEGELDLLGTTRPLAFDVTVGGDGSLAGEATFKQSDWGIKPYSALFGTLKVSDQIRVAVDGRLTAE
jgi:YceI-like domain